MTTAGMPYESNILDHDRIGLGAGAVPGDHDAERREIERLGEEEGHDPKAGVGGDPAHQIRATSRSSSKVCDVTTAANPPITRRI